ncbi:MAG: hypothetical protein WBE18_04160 [Gammaproteobacteria bacterium]
MKIAKGVLLSLFSASLALTAFADTGPCQLASPMSVFPIPMNYDAQTHGSNFFQTQGYNADGTLQANPIVNDTPYPFKGTNYYRKKLGSSDSITFPSNTDPSKPSNPSYVVYSAVPENMTIPFATGNITEYYDPAQLAANLLDIPNPPQLNPSVSLIQLPSSQTKTAVPGDNAQVFLVANNFFLPNLPSSSDQHNGLTENVYWTVDPFLNNPNNLPDLKHMLPYGWALDASTVNQSLFLPHLINGGKDKTTGSDLIKQAIQPYNHWKNVLSLQQTDLDRMNTLIQGNSNYPFPAPKWLQFGVYMPIQPMPGFQRNLIRCYTPWGAWNLLNNTSGLFVRQDGSVEFPLTSSGQPYPLVIQTWNGDQRYTLLNQTDDVIPSTQDQYPGNEYYFASNAYLPKMAGVITSYKDYTIFDDVTETGVVPNNSSSLVHYLNPRQTDLWLGLKGDSISNVMVWDKANGTEPGGQANKPYMLGADTSHNIQNGYLYYTIRLEHSNSFMIAKLAKDQDANKLYAAALYVDKGDGQYQKVATLSYQWQPWTIGDDGNWTTSPDNNMGAWVPIISDVTQDKSLANFITVSQGVGWDAANRVMPWKGLGIYKNDGSQVNTLNGPLYFYILGASIMNQEDSSAQSQNAAKSKYLVVLSPLTVNKPNYTIIPPANTAITVYQVQGANTITKPPFSFYVATQAPKSEEVDVKGTLAGNSVTCKLAVNTTKWSLVTKDCKQYFTAMTGGPGNILMKLKTPTPPPPTTSVSYTLVPPNSGVHVTADMSSSQDNKGKQDISFSNSETFSVKEGETKNINITQIGNTQLTPACALTADTTSWKLSNSSDCSSYFTSTSGGPNSSITLITLAPVTANFTLVSPVNTSVTPPVNVPVVADIPEVGTKTISGSYPFTITTKGEVTITKIGDNNVSCILQVDPSSGWSLSNQDVCSQYFTTMGGGKGSSITMQLRISGTAGYFELIPNFNNVLQKPDSIQVAPASGVAIVQPQTGVPPGAVLLAVTAPVNSPANVQITSTNAADQTLTATCVLAMTNTGWSIASNQPANADCGKFQPTGSAGTDVTKPGTIGIGMPDKSSGQTPPPPPPPTAGVGYYVISPGAGDTLDISGAGVNMQGITKNTIITISSGTIKDNTAQNMTIKITGPSNNIATCVIRIGTDTWQLVGSCDYLSPPVNAAQSTDNANSAIIGVGVP